MNFVKRYLKLFIGIAVIVLAIVVFFFAMRTGALEKGNLRDWRSASMDRRIAAVQILTGVPEQDSTIVACVDKISALDGSDKMAVRDAVALCVLGMQLKEHV